MLYFRGSTLEISKEYWGEVRLCRYHSDRTPYQVIRPYLVSTQTGKRLWGIRVL
jgi:hypothetical protein